MEPSSQMLAFARMLDAFGRRWHDYEVKGLDHLPSPGPALVVMYHGFMPLDGWLFLARMRVEHGRWLRSLTDRWLLATPGLGPVVTAGGAISGEPEAAYELLSAGETVLVSPGGTREAIGGRRWYYRVNWGERKGFARLALRAGVPLIPMFTENVEEIYRAPFAGSWPVQSFYEATRWPAVPVVGLGAMPFPVKLTTWLGEPVVPREGETSEQLRDRVREALQSLIDAKQGQRPRLLRGMVQRWW